MSSGDGTIPAISGVQPARRGTQSFQIGDAAVSVGRFEAMYGTPYGKEDCGVFIDRIIDDKYEHDEWAEHSDSSDTN